MEKAATKKPTDKTAEEKPEIKKEKAKQPDIRPEDFHWVVFGIGAGALFLLMAGALLIIRVVDGNWLSWQLPAIFGIVYFMVVSVFALVFSIKTVKQEMDMQNNKKE